MKNSEKGFKRENKFAENFHLSYNIWCQYSKIM